MNTPKVNSDGQKELKRAQEKMDAFTSEMKSFDPFTVSAPVEEKDPQTKISNREATQSDAPYIKPIRSISRTNYQSSKTDSRSYFNEAHRKLRDEDWEYVRCMVENAEIPGESVEVWTAKWGCDPAHFWRVPVNKPVMIPRLLANQLAKCQYHRLVMEDRPIEHSSMGTITGAITVDVVKNRIDARPLGFGF